MVRPPWIRAPRVRELFRFGLVGALNTAADVAVFLALSVAWPAGHDAVLGAAEALAGWTGGSLVGYLLHSRVTFRRRFSVAGYYTVAVLGAAVQSATTAAAVTWLGNAGAYGGKVAGILLAAAVSYSGYRWLARHAAAPSAVTSFP